MKKTLLFIALLQTNVFCFAEVKVINDMVYGHKDGMALVYDVIQPEKTNGAAVAYMISGGWYSIWREPRTRLGMTEDLLDAGFTIVLVYHGSSPRYHVPDAYADVSRAIRHIRLHANSYGIDPDRLGVTGGSAGGHLSLMVGFTADDGLKDNRYLARIAHSRRIWRFRGDV